MRCQRRKRRKKKSVPYISICWRVQRKVCVCGLPVDWWDITDEKDNLKNFSIVLASSVSKANADEFVDNLAKKGLNEAHVLETKSMRRVLYSYYATSSDAYKALKDLKKKSSHFSDAWVIELK